MVRKILRQDIDMEFFQLFLPAGFFLKKSS